MPSPDGRPVFISRVPWHEDPQVGRVEYAPDYGTCKCGGDCKCSKDWKDAKDAAVKKARRKVSV